MKLNKPKVGILSLGCPRNLVDSENILGRLNLKRYPLVEIDQAEIAIVNTCSFIEEAKRESIDAILDLIDLKKEGRLKKIIVYGCLTQRYKEKLTQELPEVDAFVGTVSLNHTPRRFSLSPRHYAYLKICEGCAHNCSYCIIPKLKPNFSSLDIDSLLRQVERFDQAEKISELNIIGQDISGYGMDLYGRKKLPALLKKITQKIKNIGWLRLLYLYPSPLVDEILDLIRDEPRLCKYIDLPLQHINERILKLMHRGTTKKEILSLIDKIRKKLPQAAIRTSLIVGFPSEREEEFKELAQFIEDARFERLGVFIYSREEHTPAYNFKKQVPQKIKSERFQALMLKQQKISQEINQKFLGKTIDVLVDAEEEGIYLGRSEYDAPEVDGLVYLHAQRKLKSGDFVKVRIKDTLEYDLVGEVQ